MVEDKFVFCGRIETESEEERGAWENYPQNSNWGGIRNTDYQNLYWVCGERFASGIYICPDCQRLLGLKW